MNDIDLNLSVNHERIRYIFNDQGALVDSVVTWEKIASLAPTIYTKPTSYIMGSMYRGWGMFAYNGSLDASSVMLEKHLKILDMGDESIEISREQRRELKRKYGNKKSFEDLQDIENSFLDLGVVPDPSKSYFYLMTYDSEKARYLGSTPYTYLAADTLCPARLGLLAIDTTLTQYPDEVGGICSAPILISKTNTNTVSADAGYDFSRIFRAKDLDTGLEFDINGTFSNAKTKHENRVLDLNGDGYPDLVERVEEDNEELVKVYFSNSKGLSTEVFKNDHFSMPSQESKSWSVGGNLSVSFGEPISKGKGGVATPENGIKDVEWAQKLQAVAGKNASNGAFSISASGNYSNSESSTNHDWYDFNGDGLPDMVFPNGVMYNMGKSFGEMVPFESKTEAVSSYQTQNGAAGLGVVIPIYGSADVSASIGGGVNMTWAKSLPTFQYADINADGLLDIWFIDKNNIYYSFNEGRAFSSMVYNDDNFMLESTKSTSSTAYGNTAVPISFLEIFKVVPSVKGSSTKTVSRSLNAFMDIDGDGFPDLLSSSNEDELLVRRSRIGNTNYLTKVVRPLGDSIVLHYEKTKNSYDMPH
ncbi:MAG: hypothetical protein IJ270_00390, partial [Paludibacteraceae bacterium]|nr:hypothetical protein [Paludibacteraceae bacterium]